MSTTKLANIINPQVMGDMIEAKIDAQCKLIPYAKVDTTLQGTAGDTKTVPSWNYIGDAEDFDVETASNTDAEVSTTNLTAGFTTFTIKCVMKAVSILQTAINSGLGNPIGQAQSQLAKSIIGKLDNDLVGSIYTLADAGNCIVADETAGTINYARTVNAVTKFEDEEDGIEKVMFIHPLQEESLLTDQTFISADKFQAGVAVNGSIGKIAGCWVKKSKKVQYFDYEKDNASGTITIVADSTAEANNKMHLANAQAHCKDTLVVGDKIKALATPYFMNPIIKMEPDSAETEYTEDELPALTIFLKKDTQVDHEWFPKKQKHDITASKYYGVAVTNASKVVVAKFGK